MALKKCPRCELNYIREGEKYCNVCLREMKGESDSEESVQICVECGENPVVKGSDLCAVCLNEIRRQKKLNQGFGDIEENRNINLGGVELDEIEVPIADDDIPESELDEIDRCFDEENPEDESDNDDEDDK